MNHSHGLMTEGSIPGHIIRFALPLLLGNLFQQMYNAVDSAVVGSYVGKEALASVGSSASIINLLVSLFMGISIGGSVIISQYFGAGDEDGVHDAIHTTFAFTLISGIAMTIAGVAASPAILRVMETPPDVMDLSVTYLRIFFAGSLATVVYNMGSGMLRAMGDSKRPLYYLIVSCLLNIVLDLLFVILFDMGVAGVAIATVLAQGVSAVLVVRTLLREEGCRRLILKDIRIRKEMLMRIVRIGLPSGVQNAVIALSNAVVQSSINSVGSLAMAGCSAYMKIDGFVIMPSLSLSMAMTTFVGQNIGAGKKDRVKQGVKVGLILCEVCIILLMILLQFITEPLLGIFAENPDVLAIGMMMMRIETVGYPILTYCHNTSSVLRGVGLTKVPMVVMISCWCFLRMAWIALIRYFHGRLSLVLMCYPITWVASAVILIVYMRKVNWIDYYDTQKA